MTEPAPPAPPARNGTAAAYGLVLVLTVLLALWGAFLIPFRVGGTLVPVSWAVAVVGNLALGVAGGRLAGQAGALVPGLVWVALALTFGSGRAEGDRVIPGTVTGVVFLLAGTLASAVAYGAVVVRPRPT